MKALALLLCTPLLMWTVQSVALRLHGLPIRFRIDHRSAPRSVRLSARIATQLCLAATIILYPLLLSTDPFRYYAALLPSDRLPDMLHGAAASILCLSLLMLPWTATHRLRIKVHQTRQRWMRRLILLAPTALFGALVEELVFRAVLLADLRTSLSNLPAVALGAIVFALAHYVRAVKRKWTFPGHLALGILLCLAFVATGNLWLALGLHAGGILIIMGARPFLVYQGPSWLIGESVYPYAGLSGIVGLVILTAHVARHFGVTSP